MRTASTGEKELIEEFVSPTGLQTIRIDAPACWAEVRDGVIDFELTIGTQLTCGFYFWGSASNLGGVDFFSA